jgi:outer membrane protein, multidrug efflux system
MRNTIKLSAIAMLLASLSACTVGPDYQTPSAVGSTSLDLSIESAERLQSWWQVFDDTELNALIAQGLLQNRTLAQAQVNVERAYAVFQDANNDVFPKGSLDAAYQASKNATMSGGDDGVVSRGYQNGVNLNWDLDLFGKIRRATEAAQARAQQADMLWQDAQLQLISQIANSYGDYRGAQLRLKVAEQNLLNLQQTQSIVMARVDAGMSSDLELAQIDVQLHQLKSLMPAYRTAMAKAEATLSALLALPPGQLKLSNKLELPALKQPIALVGSNSYLRYRTDVAIAERTLAASSAQIGVATADLYPNLSIRGFLGFISSPDLDVNNNSQSWTVAPALSWQAADLGSVKARIRQAEASTQMALAQFEQQVFNALNEMQLALQSYNLTREQLLSTEQQLQASQKALNIARERYQAGGEFLALLDAERDMLRSRDQLAVLQQQSFVRLVDVYRHFGGGLQLN